MILKFPFSSFDPDTLLAIKCKTKHIARIGSKVLIDGKVNGVYINACSSKGIVSVLHLGKTEKEEVVKVSLFVCLEPNLSRQMSHKKCQRLKMKIMEKSHLEENA